MNWYGANDPRAYVGTTEEIQKYKDSVSHLAEEETPNFIFSKYLAEVNQILL